MISNTVPGRGFARLLGATGAEMDLRSNTLGILTRWQPLLKGWVAHEIDKRKDRERDDIQIEKEVDQIQSILCLSLGMRASLQENTSRVQRLEGFQRLKDSKFLYLLRLKGSK